jgi:hypothetical protein
MFLGLQLSVVRRSDTLDMQLSVFRSSGTLGVQLSVVRSSCTLGEQLSVVCSSDTVGVQLSVVHRSDTLGGLLRLVRLLWLVRCRLFLMLLRVQLSVVLLDALVRLFRLLIVLLGRRFTRHIIIRHVQIQTKWVFSISRVI